MDPISFLFYCAIKARLGLYKKGVIGQRKAPGFVIGIGNLSWGGSGKTPLCGRLALWARENGLKAAVISRGYGGLRSSKRPFVVSDGSDIYASAREVGDEPFMLAKRQIGVPILICKDRFKAISLASQRFGSRFFILDDAFQHLKLKKDLEIVVVDEMLMNMKQGFNVFRMREPFLSLTRADAVVFLNCSPRSEGKGFPSLKEKGLFYGTVRAKGVLNPSSQEIYGPEVLKAQKVFAFAGIARPERFRKTLESLGAEIIGFMAFRDHHFYSPDELSEIKDKSKGADVVITTEKDWARLEGISSINGGLFRVLLVDLCMEDERRFFGWIQERVENSGLI